jgi:uncharacterized protein (DUF486 family)
MVEIGTVSVRFLVDFEFFFLHEPLGLLRLIGELILVGYPEILFFDNLILANH